MKIDLTLHDERRFEEVLDKLEAILDAIHKLGGQMSKALDDLKAEIGEIAADVDKAVELLEGFNDGATAAELAEVTATLNSAQEKLDGVVNPPPPQP